MSTLAHEGNPKEDSITISGGSVLSTAQLDINFEFFGGGGVQLTPPAALDVELSTTCAGVFTWPTIESGDDWIYFSDAPCFSTTGSRTKWADGTLDLTITSTPQCYGVIWKHIDPVAYPNSNPAGCARIDWYVGFNGVLNGTPRAGPCIWVTDATTHSIAYLYAMIYNGDLGVVQLVKWDGASLADVGYGSVLGTISVTPSVGDIFWLTMAQRPEDTGSNEVAADLRPSDFGASLGSCSFVFEDTTQQALYNQVAARHSRCGVGFVSIGGTTGGACQFIHSANMTCWNGLVPFIDIDSSGGA